jgi:deoxyribodipyrimidine photolyase-related protein
MTSNERTIGSQLVLILGDQLTQDLSALRAADRERDVVLMVEANAAAHRLPYHKKKLIFVLSAMRHFANELIESGWTVDYVRVEDPSQTETFEGHWLRAIEQYRPSKVLVTEPGEWRLKERVRSLEARVPVEILEDDRFVCSGHEFATWASGRKQLRLEYFYRDMRRKTGLLMEGNAPIGGRWNFDAENRETPPVGHVFEGPLWFAPDAITRSVIHQVETRFPSHFGESREFRFAVTTADAQRALEHFLNVGLKDFGSYQDAMRTGEPFLSHSLLSAYLNVGFLDPLAVCREVEARYRRGEVPLNSAEGFIRQVIGWREFVRGVYWLSMPDYLDSNVLGARRELPAFYWNGETDMACLRAVITQTKEHAYAHHIQRLMVTGNFAMLLGVEPNQIHEWYRSVYIDAFEWVELPNTLGMSQFADGGMLSTKPYAASGNYIKRMSDYCDECRFNVKHRVGADACPFNALYWDFVARNEDTLGENPRMRNIFNTWAQMSTERQTELREAAERFLRSIG